YTLAIDIWSIGCTFGELLTGKPLFLRLSVVHQLDLMTDLIGTPSADTIAWTINGLEVEFERRRITKEDTRLAALEKDYEEVRQDAEEDMKKKKST
nr:mitogen-activated protein kinase 16 [Tanacetum cinerariifolium]